MYKQIVDLSHHNTVNDWKKLSDSVDGVIIRMGYGKNNEDKKAKEFLKGAIEYGVPYALYWYSYALNPVNIAAEAQYLCEASRGYSPRFLALDMEDADSYKMKNGVFANELALIQNCTNLVNYWEEEMKAITTLPIAVYMNNNWWKNAAYIPGDDVIKWVARWSDEEPTVPWDIWQYSSKASVAGAVYPVDISKTEDKQNLWGVVDEVLYEDENVKLGYRSGSYYLEIVDKYGMDNRK